MNWKTASNTLLLLCVVPLLSRTCSGQSFRQLITTNGCIECHGNGQNNVGPDFHSIATRYRDDLANYAVHLIDIKDVGELPERGYSELIAANIGGELHLRIFDKNGARVVDQPVARQKGQLHDFIREWRTFSSRPDQPVPTRIVEGPLRKRLVDSLLKEELGFSRSWKRNALIETIQRGGKGHWTHISKGVPMPPFGKRLTDAEIATLVDGILGTTKLKLMIQGLGSGTIVSSPAGIICSSTCEQDYDSPEALVLTAVPDAGSRFVRWEGDITGTLATGSVSMEVDRSVRAWFEPDPAIPQLDADDLTPETIRDFLVDHPQIQTAAQFLAALPDRAKFEENWILMTRSESLQTGIARYPRILLPSEDARNVFTFGLTPHVSFPGSHPNAIEYMQWDGLQKNFRFHEIVLSDIPEMSATFPDGSERPTFPSRPRGVSIDDSKCFKCHSTQNVLNLSTFPGTTGITPGAVPFKSKPNWDSYDSWGGMMPFNRDRVYQGSIEAAAFRRTFNPWNWRYLPEIRRIIEQLRLQPMGVPTEDIIIQHQGGTYDGHIQFAFDSYFPVPSEPLPEGEPASWPDIQTNYSFDGRVGTGSPTNVVRHGKRVKLYDSRSVGDSEGRGVEFFDILGGLDDRFNQQRIADELVNHRIATGSVPIDVRPIALAIAQGFVQIDSSNNTVTSAVPLSIPLDWFTARNGMSINELRADTEYRARSIPRRKADLQYRNLNRWNDPYLSTSPAGGANGLVLEFGSATTLGTDLSLARLRQEVFRRPVDMGSPDETVMNHNLPGYYVDRELYFSNSDQVTLFRYFLEPLGVSIDKWSMGVRGRSRAYAFADVLGGYLNEIIGTTGISLIADGTITDSNNQVQVIAAVNASLAAGKLPAATAIPTYTDIQRILNKSCIECHGGLNYPPYSNFYGDLDFSEDEQPTTSDYFARFRRAHDQVMSRTTNDPVTSSLYRRITRPDELSIPRLMPFEGPALSKCDTETIRRWIIGGRPNTVGDPHIRTVDGVNYDFQAAGEFVFLRDVGIELQVRQTAVATARPLGPDPYTGLTSCVSINSAVAMRIGDQRISYQPVAPQQSDSPNWQLRIDGEAVNFQNAMIPLKSGARLLPTIAPFGMQLEMPGGSVIVVTPGWWEHQKVWYLNIDCRHIRATEGLMGAVAPGNWLPALPDGSWLGPRPEDLRERRNVLYEKFGKAWRVTDQNSLFDYAPGTSTSTFARDHWPSDDPNQRCHLAGEDTPVSNQPQQPIKFEEASELCKDIIDPDRREDAIKDVMATGERGFAKTYLLADLIERNRPPTIPNLVFPPLDASNVPVTFDFQWEQSIDEDGDPVSYRLLVWKAGEPRNNNQAAAVSSRDAKFQSRKSRELISGQIYFWTVIAEDGKGGTVESETRQFTVRKD